MVKKKCDDRVQHVSPSGSVAVACCWIEDGTHGAVNHEGNSAKASLLSSYSILGPAIHGCYFWPALRHDTKLQAHRVCKLHRRAFRAAVTSLSFHDGKSGDVRAPRARCFCSSVLSMQCQCSLYKATREVQTSFVVAKTTFPHIGSTTTVVRSAPMALKFYHGSICGRQLVLAVAMDSFEMMASVYPEMTIGPCRGRADTYQSSLRSTPTPSDGQRRDTHGAVQQ
jgi:hypothetical protein